MWIVVFNRVTEEEDFRKCGVLEKVGELKEAGREQTTPSKRTSKDC